MLKRKVFTGCLIMAMVIGSACTKENNGKEDFEKNQQVTLETQETTQETTQDSITEAAGELTEDMIKQLVDEGIYCNLNVFGMTFLPRNSEGIEYNGRKLYQVDETVFADYASFEEYIRSVYCKETAELYLYKVPYEDMPRYVNVDGKLYVDTDGEGGKGYYVDWSEYTIEIRKQTETRCEFTVTASVEWPADVPVKEPYPVENAVVLEDGRWVLEKFIY